MGGQGSSKILEQLKSGPKSLQELVKVTGAKEGVVKGQLTRLERAGKVEKTEDGKYKLK
ncbi:MAG: TrmB family transcriptional regulator [Candidatus Korarchaeum sp.]